MFKSFEKSRAMGPAISVRFNNGSRTYSRPSYVKTSRVSGSRSSRRGWLVSLKALVTPAGDFKQYAVYGLMGLLGVLVISHVLLINGASANGYEMRKIQNAIAQQTEIEQNLELKTAQMASLNSVDQAAAMNRLVTVTNQEFLAPATITAYRTASK